MSYLQPIMVFLLVLFPVLLPVTISGFHGIADVLRKRPMTPFQTTTRRPLQVANSAA
jgi:hypothetical protein